MNGLIPYAPFSIYRKSVAWVEPVIQFLGMKGKSVLGRAYVGKLGQRGSRLKCISRKQVTFFDADKCFEKIISVNYIL
jgi:hypothetical protein